MQTGKNKVVGLHYKLEIDDNGTKVTVDQSAEGNPLVFLFGAGMLLPEFEKNISGKVVGETFDFVLSPEDGYGVSVPEQVVEISIDVFRDPQGNIDRELLTVGKVLPMQDNHGNHFNGLITKVSIETITMDFNHPLADKHLHFTGHIVEVREATAEELDHGHVHGPGGHHHH